MKRILLFWMLVFPSVGNSKDNFNGNRSVGATARNIEDTERKRQLDVQIWYPTDSKAKPTARDSGGVFKPTLEIVDAPLSAGSKLYPIVLMSHGAGGNKLNQGWMATALAVRGYVVVSLNHTGDTSEDTTYDAFLYTWKRPRDISFALDRLLKDPFLAGRVDKNRLYALGHSAGGVAVIELAGGRLRADQAGKPLGACDESNRFSFDECTKLLAFDFKGLDRKLLEESHTDARIKRVLALDPGLYRWFDQKSLDALKGKVAVFAAGTETYPGQNIGAENFEKHLAPGDAVTIPSAKHFDFLPECDPVIAAKRRVPICQGGDRASIHKQVVEQAVRWFQ
jgi:predicted dienelactone hydrolase